MTIYRIEGFDNAPHWDVAFIEAETEADARRILLMSWVDREEYSSGTMNWWERVPEEKWEVTEAVRPLKFILGGGCR